MIKAGPAPSSTVDNSTHAEFVKSMCNKLATCEPGDQDHVCAVDYNTGAFVKLHNKCELYKHVCDLKGGKGNYLKLI